MTLHCSLQAGNFLGPRTEIFSWFCLSDLACPEMLAVENNVTVPGNLYILSQHTTEV